MSVPKDMETHDLTRTNLHHVRRRKHNESQSQLQPRLRWLLLPHLHPRLTINPRKESSMKLPKHHRLVGLGWEQFFQEYPMR
jgi:hypothetical protein